MNWRPAASLLRALCGLAIVACLGACSSLPFFRDNADDDEKGSDGAARTVAQYSFEVDPPGPLATLLQNYLDLARFQNAPETDAITGNELDRLVVAAPAQARALLETEGYFDSRVTIAQTPPSGAGGLPLVRMSVVPGPRVRITRVRIEATGPLAARTAGRDPPGATRLDIVRRDWKLPPGRPFREAAWSDAKNAALAEVRADGYPKATWAATQARVDAEAHTAELSLTLDSGPLHRLGAIRIDGLQRFDDETVRRLATFAPGTTYNEQLLLDYQERLIKVGLFESASVAIDPDTNEVDAVPVLVKVQEQTLQQATFGVGYSANTGPRVSLEHVDRKLFGQRWIARSKIELGPDLKSIGSELTSYPREDLSRNLLAGKYERLNSADELRNAWSARVGRAKDTTRFERLYYAELSHARVDSAPLTTSSGAVSVNYHWLRRDIDNPILPTEGTTLAAQGGVGYGSGTQTIKGLADAAAGGADEKSHGPFVRLYSRLDAYQPIGAWYGSARVELGQVFVHDRIGVPDTTLFRAGGDDSVRGYGYRTLGPRVNGAVVGGRVLATGTVEMAHPLSRRLPSLWGALFVDAGNAADGWGGYRPVLGYGAGLRWRSPVGPLRVDLAWGQDVQRLRLHVSVGIAF